MNENDQKTILVVDDEPFVLESISLLLKGFGYSVTACPNAKTALARLDQTGAGVVLTDIKMPSISGIEFLEKIRISYPETPVILMTAYAELDVAMNAIKKGAFDFIIKPYDPEYLLQTIEKALKHSALIQMERNYKIMLEDMVNKRTQELVNALTMVKTMSREVIERLTAVAEFRDTDTGAHISRITLYSK